MQNSVVTALLVLTMTLSACNSGPTDLEQRLTNELKLHNDGMLLEFDHGCQNLRRRLEEESLFGNKKLQTYAEKVGQIQQELKDASSALERVANPEYETPADSIMAFLLKWKTSKRAFWTEVDPRERYVNWDDSTEGYLIMDTPSRFSKNRKPFWKSEIEIIRSQIIFEEFHKLDFFKSRVKLRDFILDTLSFEDILQENPVIAGEDAKVYLRLVKTVPELQPKFEGSGFISVNPFAGTALMRIKTSEAMIPDGQKEGFVNYQAKAKIPTEDGGQIEYHLTGKVKIRRPSGDD
ncbi:MAG TPA: hypothetical protein VHS96_06660 [Bacteroidia bacterium]|nr:hypothetical protein [Bacteroidia bacterium]